MPRGIYRRKKGAVKREFYYIAAPRMMNEFNGKSDIDEWGHNNLEDTVAQAVARLNSLPCAADEYLIVKAVAVVRKAPVPVIVEKL